MRMKSTKIILARICRRMKMSSGNIVSVTYTSMKQESLYVIRLCVKHLDSGIITLALVNPMSVTETWNGFVSSAVF